MSFLEVEVPERLGVQHGLPRGFALIRRPAVALRLFYSVETREAYIKILEAEGGTYLFVQAAKAS